MGPMGFLVKTKGVAHVSVKIFALRQHRREEQSASTEVRNDKTIKERDKK